MFLLWQLSGGFAVCQVSGLWRLCSASDKAKESISGGESTLGAVSGKEQIETVQRLFIFGITKGFSIPPHYECSRYEVASTFSREGATELSKISSKIF